MRLTKRRTMATRWLLGIFCAIGFVSPANADREVAKFFEDAKARMQSTRWNLARAFHPTDPEVDGVSIVTIAGASKRQLREWMRNCPPPSLQEMNGTWRGLNRGVGPAVLGFSQFAKHMCTNCNCGHGDNITIKQVGPSEWCSGRQSWLAVRKNGELDRKGNYMIEFNQGARLNYGAADNPKCDPSRFLVDKIVKLDERFLLGKAIYKVGLAKVTVAYFVLERT